MQVSCRETTRIGVVFFGITRSLRFTAASIRKNVIGPAESNGAVRVFAHFFDEQRIENPRSGENGFLYPREHEILHIDDLVIEAPNECLELRGFSTLTSFGDLWGDGFKSLRNLVHQLHSMERVTERALDWGADIVVFVRPDLEYHDSLEPVLRDARKLPETAFVPYWQAYGGLNDRFAVVSGQETARVYGTRIRRALDYCISLQRPLGSEELLAFSLEGLTVRSFGQRASRVRFDGSIRYERFDHPVTWKIIKHLSGEISNKQIRAFVRGSARLGQAVLIGPRYRGLDRFRGGDLGG